MKLGDLVMPTSIARSLAEFPEHARLIGDMLIGYGEIEFIVVALVSDALHTDTDQAVRVLYRMRGAEERLNVADGIIRPFYSKIKLGGPYGQWVGAMRRCKTIRNQYAHCAWIHKGSLLAFADLVESAQSVEGNAKLNWRPLRIELVREQHAYFMYAEELTWYLLKESRYRLDRRRRHRHRLPKSRPAPSLDNLQDLQSVPEQGRDTAPLRK